MSIDVKVTRNGMPYGSVEVADVEQLVQDLRDNAGRFSADLRAGTSLVMTLTRSPSEPRGLGGEGGRFDGKVFVDVEVDGAHYVSLGEVTFDELLDQMLSYQNDYVDATEVVITMTRGGIYFPDDFESDLEEEDDSYGPEGYRDEDDEDIDDESPETPLKASYGSAWNIPEVITSEEFLSIVTEALNSLSIGDVLFSENLNFTDLYEAVSALPIGRD